MKNLLLSLALFASPVSLWAQDFSAFQSLLSKHLRVTQLPGGGLQTAFDYESLKADSISMKKLAEQAQSLKAFDIKSLDSKEKATSFWINSYNFFMVKIIMDKGFKKEKLDINSVKDFGSFFSPYAIFKEELIEIGGKKYSLDKIEKGTLLGKEYKKKGWKDARIHFAVNCASVGCPPLIAKVYSPDSLNKVLDDNIKMAFRTPRHLNIKGKDLHLTHLFKWYKDDFKEHSGSVKAFIKKYVDDSVKIDSTEDIEYIEYDWNLNKPQNFKK